MFGSNYAVELTIAVKLWVDATITIDPPPDLIMAGIAYFVP